MTFKIVSKGSHVAEDGLARTDGGAPDLTQGAVKTHEGRDQVVGAVGVGQRGGHHRVQGGARGEELSQ